MSHLAEDHCTFCRAVMGSDGNPPVTERIKGYWTHIFILILCFYCLWRDSLTRLDWPKSGTVWKVLMSRGGDRQTNNNPLWRYRYWLYRTNQHRTGTDNYRYSNGQQLGVYWFIRGDKQIYMQDRWIVSAGRLTVRVAGMLGFFWLTRDPCGGGGEVQVTSVESRGQPDAGWLAATPCNFFIC